MRNQEEKAKSRRRDNMTELKGPNYTDTSGFFQGRGGGDPGHGKLAKPSLRMALEKTVEIKEESCPPTYPVPPPPMTSCASATRVTDRANIFAGADGRGHNIKIAAVYPARGKTQRQSGRTGHGGFPLCLPGWTS